MAKTALVCLHCGHRALQWVGRCPGCGAWDSLAEAAASSNGTGDAGIAISEIDLSSNVRLPTGLGEFDRVLGGGLVKGSVVLVAGEPGVGKSTLMLQAAAGLEAGGNRISFFCGEESLSQVASRAQRLGGPVNARVSDATDVQVVAGLVPAADVVVVDSVQTLLDPDGPGRPGTVSQVTACSARLTTAAKRAGTSLVLVGHVTKDGSVAGPRTLEHLVDVVLTFEGDRGHSLRTLRGVKNRFGATGELGVFQIGAGGLVEVTDASGLFLEGRKPETPGCVVSCVLEGRRRLAIEIQALVVQREAGIPRRVAHGLDGSRLAVLLAVLERHAALSTSSLDVYSSIAGGLRASDPGIDLPLALAVGGSLFNRGLLEEVAAVGEVGLGGEVRQVYGLVDRIRELARLGFRKVVVPKCDIAGEDAKVIQVETVAEALGVVYG